ncbi:hypothetical protein HAX54_036822 [Datura stramonium]|uniref:Uncharacterized protein n=1 Tax=Datura stramonium TaxID=4076 RepID=A0ABS8RMJ5_DATST|nr:hypothetical protein [Datura stramonium]
MKNSPSSTSKDVVSPFQVAQATLVKTLFLKPQGGNLGENDMDYDSDAKTMAALRRQLEIALREILPIQKVISHVEQLAIHKCNNLIQFPVQLFVLDLSPDSRNLFLLIKKYISSFLPERREDLVHAGHDRVDLALCIGKATSESFGNSGCMSASILLAEATILPSGVDLSLFSILINAMKKDEMLVQVAAFIPLMICGGMVARYAPPISYNFLNLIHLDNNAKTIFEKNASGLNKDIAGETCCSIGKEFPNASLMLNSAMIDPKQNHQQD